MIIQSVNFSFYLFDFFNFNNQGVFILFNYINHPTNRFGTLLFHGQRTVHFCFTEILWNTTKTGLTIFRYWFLKKTSCEQFYLQIK